MLSIIENAKLSFGQRVPSPLVPNSLILLNKKPGITSFDALREIKRGLTTGKAGHTGTLDKFAQGLLIVLVGKALKLTKYFMHCDKQYIGKIRFGEETDTLDPEGAVIAKALFPSREQVESVLSQFTGSVMQTPPVFSALHIGGKRASELARAGQAPEMKSRPVTIYKLELKSWEPPFAKVFVHCSSGTYIRSLARDIALAAGSRGHLVELTRTKIAEFELPVNSEQLTVNSEQLTVNSVDKSVIEKLGIPVLDISLEQAKLVRHGKPLEQILCAAVPSCEALSLALFCSEELTAIIEKHGDKWKYGAVFT